MQSGMLDTLCSALLFACICMFAVCGQPDGCSNLVIMGWFFFHQAMTAVLGSIVAENPTSIYCRQGPSAALVLIS